MGLSPQIYQLLVEQPPTNPGYLCSQSRPLSIVDCSTGQSGIFGITGASTKSLWMIGFNFANLPLLATQGTYVTGVSYVDVTPNDNSLVVVTNSQFLNLIGITLQGGTLSKNYAITVGATLSNSQVVSYTLNIQIN